MLHPSQEIDFSQSSLYIKNLACCLPCWWLTSQFSAYQGQLYYHPALPFTYRLSPFCSMAQRFPLDSPAGPYWPRSRARTPRAPPWKGIVSRRVGEERRPPSLLQGIREPTQSPTLGFPRTMVAMKAQESHGRGKSPLGWELRISETGSRGH